jgi:zinc ribbon protein
MAKHCTNCEHELRDTDKFCAECGTAVGGVTSQSQPTQWEYCDIATKVMRERATFLSYYTACCFQAEGAGQNGVFIAGTSPVFEVENESGGFDYRR